MCDTRDDCGLCPECRETDVWPDPPASTETGLGADLSDFRAESVPTHVERLDRDGGEQR